MLLTGCRYYESIKQQRNSCQEWYEKEKEATSSKLIGKLTSNISKNDIISPSSKYIGVSISSQMKEGTNKKSKRIIDNIKLPTLQNDQNIYQSSQMINNSMLSPLSIRPEPNSSKGKKNRNKRYLQKDNNSKYDSFIHSKTEELSKSISYLIFTWIIELY